MADDPRILVIDDSAADRALLGAVLRDELGPVRVREVKGALDFAELLGYRSWSVALAERTLAWADGVEILAAIKQRHPRCLTVLFTSTAADEVGVLGAHLGVDAYVRKESAGYLRLAQLIRDARSHEVLPGDQPRRTLRGGIDAFPIGYFWILANGQILEANPALRRLLGIDPEEDPTQRNLTEFIADDEHRARCEQALARGAREQFFVTQLGQPSGHTIPVVLSFWPVPDGHGRACLEGIVWEASPEITAEQPASRPLAASTAEPGAKPRVLLEDEPLPASGSAEAAADAALLQREAAQGAETPEQAAMIAPAAVTPIRVTELPAAVAERPRPSPEVGESAPDAAPDAAVEAALVAALAAAVEPDPALVSGLDAELGTEQHTEPDRGPDPEPNRAPDVGERSMELSLNANQLEAVPLKDAVMAAMERLRPTIAESQARIRAAPLPTVQANRSELVRLFKELLDNAIKYRSEKRPQISVRAEEHVDGWLLSVRDNGRGIPPEQRAQLFGHEDRVDRSDHPGSGLAICRHIARRYGGDIWVTSEPRAGTTFFVALKARLTEPEPVSLSIHFNGKQMGSVSVSNARSRREIARAALSLPQLQRQIGDQTIKYVQFVDKDVVNIVA